jgi:hypothetical protein
MSTHEYTRPTVNSGVCTYTPLRDYNSGFGRGPVAPIMPGTPSMANTIVPKYCPASFGPGPNYQPKYDTLLHGQGQYACGGYFNIHSAYPYATGKTCATKFVQRPCDGVACRPEGPGGGTGGRGGTGGGGGATGRPGPAAVSWSGNPSSWYCGASPAEGGTWGRNCTSKGFETSWSDIPPAGATPLNRGHTAYCGSGNTGQMCTCGLGGAVNCGWA